MPRYYAESYDAPDVEERHVRPRRQPVHHRRLPQPVDAKAHQVVHQVVAGCHRIKDLPDEGRLIGLGHAPVTEVRRGRFLSWLLGHGRNIA